MPSERLTPDQPLLKLPSRILGPVLKSTLIAIAALTAFDAVAWQSQYRIHLVREAKVILSYVTDQDWTSGPLV